MTITLTAAQEQELAELSASNGLAPEILAERAIDQFLSYRDGLEHAVKEARDADMRGETFTHEQVRDRIEKMLAS